uniref:Uncharacterized protein n=1 Tax=Acrobeloides nanus TaxID=290746 RepID=A0A914C6R9_9BILA
MMGGINIPDDPPVEFYSPNLHFLRRDVSIQFNSTNMCSEADNENESWSSLISIFACYKTKKIIMYLKDGRKIINDIIEKPMSPEILWKNLLLNSLCLRLETAAKF